MTALLSLVFFVAALAAAQVPDPTILNIRVVEGDGAVHRAGARAAVPLAVQVTDEIGKPIDGAAVSFRLPDSGPSGVFASGLTSELLVTDSQGRAAIHGTRWNSTTGAFQVRVTASKGQARAGILVSQYLSDAPPANRNARVENRGRRRWILMLAGAGGAAGGLALGLSRGSSTSASSDARGAQVGPPAISIGNP
jgi:hypothetical protein